MKNNKSLLSHAVKAGIFSLTLLSAAQVHAESPPIEQILPEPYIIDDLFAKADIDGDGMISAEEHYKLHTAKALMKFEMTFKAIDENGDGLAQLEEYLRFLPAIDESVLIEQYYSTAGTDEMLDSEEFSVMRLKDQGVNNDSMWEFALLDQDHDGKLAPHEFFANQLAIIEPPILIIDPTPVKPPELIIDPMPIKPPTGITDPEGVITLPDGTVLHPDGTVVRPGENTANPDGTITLPDGTVLHPDGTVTHVDENTTNGGTITLPDGTVIPVPVDPNVFVGPPNPVDPDITQVIDEELINSLKEKLARFEEKLTRLDKSILMTTKRIMSTTDDKKLARLERRLKRQTDRLAKYQDLYQMALKELGEAQ